jgi:hypothetical protein
MNPFDLNLPSNPRPDRVAITAPIGPGEKKTFANLDGPGCIRHVFVVLNHPQRAPQNNRRIVIRIYFDDSTVPQVQAPVGDFFGLMHGQSWYDINTPVLAAKNWSGMNCYFPMPFAQTARIEFENGPSPEHVYLMVDWSRYPGKAMREDMRFCARWRRENPTQCYGPMYMMLDADGPGQLAGFVYGVRLIDNTDRWSHGGADNLHIDGEGDEPVYLRGIGGEDTFGSGYGGALHPPETHLYAAMPYYTHEDTGEARPAQRLAGYRFFIPDPVRFQESLHMRFGCMCNDICSTVYWYQRPPLRPFVKLPDWPKLLPGTALSAQEIDLPLPDSGSWWLCGPFDNQSNQAMATQLPAETESPSQKTYDGLHADGSPWLTEGSRELGRNVARWVKRPAIHGFVDFNHVFQPQTRGVGVFGEGAAVARAVLEAPSATTATLRLAWDDHLVLHVNGEMIDLGCHTAFRQREIQVPLRAGANQVALKLSNTRGSNHGGWAFAFRATTADGRRLHPRLDGSAE